MADIAQVIQGGTDRLVQGGMQMREQSRSDKYLALQEQQMKAALSAKADQITDSTLLAIASLNKKASAARKKRDEIGALVVDNTEPSTIPGIPIMPKKDPKAVAAAYEAANIAETAYQAALDERNALIESIAGMPGVMIAMDQSSYHNKDIGEQVFNKEVLDSMPETQRERIISQLTALAEAKQALMQKETTQQEAYAKEHGKLQAQSEFGVLDKETKGSTKPRVSVLSDTQYLTNYAFQDSPVTKTQAEKYYLRDMATYYPLYDQLEEVDETNKKFIHSLFTKWPNMSGMSQEDQLPEVKKFAKILDEYSNAPTDDPLSRKILEDLQDIVSSKEGNVPLRIGAFMNQLKGFYSPNIPTLRPRVTAESGS